MLHSNNAAYQGEVWLTPGADQEIYRGSRRHLSSLSSVGTGSVDSILDHSSYDGESIHFKIKVIRLYSQTALEASHTLI